MPQDPVSQPRIINADAGRPDTARALANILDSAGRVVLGKQEQIKLALACMLAGGHLLIEDYPGVGKTTLAQTLATVLGLQFQRIQFTSDLLPADVIGVSVYERDSGSFTFHPGPVFAQVLLGDEINRATPKTQSALLEAMGERQVTIDGDSRPLPTPFHVIATQNPGDQAGTFPLPESQLDRFLMSIQLGYPDAAAERELFRSGSRLDMVRELQAEVDAIEWQTLCTQVDTVHASDALLDYLQALVEQTRHSSAPGQGLSPRAGLALLRSAKAWALIHTRTHVLPEDLQAVMTAVASHRLQLQGDTREMAVQRVRQIITDVPVP